MSTDVPESRDLRHVHLIEPTSNLGHGPLWLGYLIDALQAVMERLTVSYPDAIEYRHVVEPRASARNICARPYRDRRSGRRALRASLAGAARLDADLTVFSDLGWLIRRGVPDLRRATASPIRGIWFSPPAATQTARWHPGLLLNRRARLAWRERRALVRAPDWLSGIWVLDPALIDRFHPRPGLRVDALPDPWPTRPAGDRAGARRRLDLPADRKLFLHIGVSAPRKGLDDAIEAWQRLTDVADAVLLRAGPVSDGERTALAPLIESGRALLREQRPSDAELDDYLLACDWLLLPYRHHEGSSGLLTGAAVYGRPVIASNYGVLGRRVSQAGLGLLFAHLSADSLADAVGRAIAMPATDFDAGLRRYALDHDREHFDQAVRRACRP